jgi:hypothetical protein
MKAHQCKANREEGQSIVILAMAMVGLLVFAGLAVDAGVIYVTSVRLARAVDAGALAGVVELPYETDADSTDNADERAQQFLAANEVWPTAEITGTEFFDSAREGGVFGTVRYLITATHQADLYFLPLVGLRYVRLRDSAAAEYNPLISIYASQTGNYGIEQTVNLSIFGPRICTSYGDAYTPRTYDNSGTSNPWWDELEGVYHFRLDIPDDYESEARSLTADQNEGTDTNDIVRIEIWDPDCYNDPFPGNQFVITNTSSPTEALMTVSSACGGNDRIQPCTPETGDPQNPYGFVRIDENRGHGTPPGDGQCDAPDSYTPGYNTVTEYTLYYYFQRPDGSLERRDLARYTKGGAEGDSDTDMLWVSPGGSLPWDPPADAGFTPDEGDGDFEIGLSTETASIYRNPADGSRSLFLDVRGVEGASENGFDLWAGPRYINVPSEVNARNVDIILNPGEYHSSAGATWAGMGHLPMNNNTKDAVAEIILTYVPQEYAGRRIVVQSFDNDYPDLVDRIDFYFSSVSKDDWSVQMTPSGGNEWTEEGEASFTVPSAPTHTFYGGYLMVEYEANDPHDTFGWKITTDATPWLVE